MTIVDEFRCEEQRVLDRLVDGELGPQERIQLLAALDDEPGAWRRCALAFLEAQSWRWQLARAAAEPLAKSTDPVQPLAPNRPRSRAWASWLATAACVLVAFGIGRSVPRFEQPKPIANQAPREVPDSDLALADEPSWMDDAPWERLTLAGEGDDLDDPLQLFLARGDEAADLADSQAISERFLEQLEQAGWQITREQRLLPVSLSDGRRVVVPIEEVDARHPERAYY
jgi:hypothetical protein